jgi:hypothetical protein
LAAGDAKYHYSFWRPVAAIKNGHPWKSGHRAGSGVATDSRDAQPPGISVGAQLHYRLTGHNAQTFFRDPERNRCREQRRDEYRHRDALHRHRITSKAAALIGNAMRPECTSTRIRLARRDWPRAQRGVCELLFAFAGTLSDRMTSNRFH